MTRVEIRERDHLAFTSGLSAKTPGQRGPDQEEVAFAGERDYDGQCAPRYVFHIRHAKIENFDDAMGPSGSDCTAAVTISTSRLDSLGVRLMNSV